MTVVTNLEMLPFLQEYGYSGLYVVTSAKLNIQEISKNLSINYHSNYFRFKLLIKQSCLRDSNIVYDIFNNVISIYNAYRIRHIVLMSCS